VKEQASLIAGTRTNTEEVHAQPCWEHPCQTRRCLDTHEADTEWRMSLIMSALPVTSIRVSKRRIRQVEGCKKMYVVNKYEITSSSQSKDTCVCSTCLRLREKHRHLAWTHAVKA